VNPPAIPRRGDLVWVDFIPQTGREQSGRRPALILSPENYNRKTGLAVACPVTSQVKGYPFEVSLQAGIPITSAASIGGRGGRNGPAAQVKASLPKFAENSCR